jgi:glyoxylase-like metal-dependent hydrolase (beta-lactamase superfamily II)
MMTTSTLSIGAVRVDALSDGYLDEDRATFFPTLPASDFADHPEAFVDGRLRFPLTSYLIRTDGRTVLVDTGLGPRMRGGRSGVTGLLPGALAALGVTPEQIDTVLFTHLHFDHVGWSCVERDGTWSPRFPNARYLIRRPEWERWSAESYRYLEEHVRPLLRSHQAELVDDGCEPAPGVRMLDTPGHTPGHVSVLVYSRGEGGVITGDAAHTPLELERPECSPAIDEDPAQSAASRTMLVERIEAEGLMVLGGHFPPPNAGRLLRVGPRRVYQPLP